MALTDQQLALKKRLLQHRSALLRTQLGHEAARTVAPVLGLSARVRSGGQWLGAHPWWLVGAAAALLVASPRSIMSLAGRALWLWQTWQKVQPLLGGQTADTPVTPKD